MDPSCAQLSMSILRKSKSVANYITPKVGPRGVQDMWRRGDEVLVYLSHVDGL